MKLELVQKQKEQLQFVVRDVSPAYVNTLRRVFMAEVPTMAIETVEFRKNASSLYDEMIAHRLGLVSLKTDLKSYSEKESCKCKGAGCASCELKLTLKVKGPCTVYASDIKSKDPKVVPTFPKTPIATLLENQELEAEMTAQLGRGKEHAKWSPCIAFYTFFPKVTTKGATSTKAVAESCPVNVHDLETGNVSAPDKSVHDCAVCRAYRENPSKPKVEIKDDYLFTIESFGQLEPKEIVEKGLEVLNKQLDECTSLLKA